MFVITSTNIRTNKNIYFTINLHKHLLLLLIYWYFSPSSLFVKNKFIDLILVYSSFIKINKIIYLNFCLAIFALLFVNFGSKTKIMYHNFLLFCGLLLLVVDCVGVDKKNVCCVLNFRFCFYHVSCCFVVYSLFRKAHVYHMFMLSQCYTMHFNVKSFFQ